MVTSPWYAVQVRSRSEFTASDYLTVSGYDTFLPSYKEIRRWSDRSKLVQVPFFPGYVFCRLNINARLPVLQAPGVLSIVGFGNRFEPVDEADIAAVRAVADSQVFARPCPYLTVGQSVVLTRGPLAGIEGLLMDVKNERRLIVSIHLLQRSLAVHVDLADVKAVNKQFSFVPNAMNQVIRSNRMTA